LPRAPKKKQGGEKNNVGFVPRGKIEKGGERGKGGTGGEKNNSTWHAGMNGKILATPREGKEGKRGHKVEKKNRRWVRKMGGSGDRQGRGEGKESAPRPSGGKGKTAIAMRRVVEKRVKGGRRAGERTNHLRKKKTSERGKRNAEEKCRETRKKKKTRMRKRER